MTVHPSQESDRLVSSIGRRALVVEDDSGIRMLTAKILRRDGFSVSEATNGEEAVSLLQDGQSFEVIVLDVAMPRMDGIEVIRYVRSTSPQALKKIVVMTANARILRDRMAEGVCELLLKPFNIDEFLMAVRRCSDPSDS